jgi:hypothetical protein
VGLAEGGAAGEALEIAHPAEAATQAVAGRRIRGEGADRILSLTDRRAVEERAQEPLAQQPRAHRRARPVDRPDERTAARPLGRRLEELEGGDGGRIEEHRIAGHEPLDPREVREGLTLRIGEIRERGPRRLQARRHRPHAEGIERRWPEAGDEPFPGGPRREPSRLAGRHRHAERFALSAPWPVGVARHQELGGPPEQRRLEQGGARALLLPDPEVPGGDVDEGRPEGARRAMQREEKVVRGPVQELRVGDGARRDDAHDLAPHELLALGRRLHLLAHGDLLARSDEARDVTVGGVMRDPRHRDRPLAFLARRERELQQAGRGVRVLEEQLVEISEAEQQQIVRVALLELPVLQHHRSQLGRGLRHESSAADRRS